MCIHIFLYTHAHTYREYTQQLLNSSEGAGSAECYFCGSLLVFMQWDNPSAHGCLSCVVMPSPYRRPQSILLQLHIHLVPPRDVQQKYFHAVWYSIRTGEGWILRKPQRRQVWAFLAQAAKMKNQSLLAPRVYSTPNNSLNMRNNIKVTLFLTLFLALFLTLCCLQEHHTFPNCHYRFSAGMVKFCLLIKELRSVMSMTVICSHCPNVHILLLLSFHSPSTFHTVCQEMFVSFCLGKWNV